MKKKALVTAARKKTLQMRERRTYSVRFYRDEDDAAHWIARVLPDSLGVHSFGRTIEEARRNVREALALAIGEPAAAAAAFDEKIELPAKVRQLIEKAKTARASARALEEQATNTQRAAAELLTRELGLSLRDAGALLEVSHAAVSKVLAGRSVRRNA